MANFAKINEDSIIETVLAIDDEKVTTAQEFLAVELGLGGTWVETKLDGSIRFNPAIPGGTYNADADAFILPQPFASWTLNESTFTWEAPIERPEGDFYWDEETQIWVNFTPPTE